jgi:hypothetical protein
MILSSPPKLSNIVILETHGEESNLTSLLDTLRIVTATRQRASKITRPALHDAPSFHRKGECLVILQNWWRGVEPRSTPITNPTDNHGSSAHTDSYYAFAASSSA